MCIAKVCGGKFKLIFTVVVEPWSKKTVVFVAKNAGYQFKLIVTLVFEPWSKKTLVFMKEKHVIVGDRFCFLFLFSKLKIEVAVSQEVGNLTSRWLRRPAIW